jgi:hypothetical protein
MELNLSGIINLPWVVCHLGKPRWLDWG